MFFFILYLLRFLLLRHAPLGVCSTICRHQPAQRTVLGQVDCFVQCEVVGSQIALDGVQPHDTRTPWWSPPVVWRGSRQSHLGFCVIIHTYNMPKYWVRGLKFAETVNYKDGICDKFRIIDLCIACSRTTSGVKVGYA